MEKVVGSKAVALKTVFRLPYFNTTVEDGRVEVERLYIKLLPDGKVFAYGACRATLLFSRLDVQKRRFFGVESAELPLCEELECPAAPGLLRPAFAPILRFERDSAGSYLWKVAVEGPLSLIADEAPRRASPAVEEPAAAFCGRTPPAPAPRRSDEASAGRAPAAGGAGGPEPDTGVTVLRLSDLGIPAGELLHMNRDVLRGLLGEEAKASEKAGPAAAPADVFEEAAGKPAPEAVEAALPAAPEPAPPVQEEVPVQKTVPAEEKAPAQKTAPARRKAPAQEATPAEETLATQETASVPEKVPAQETSAPQEEAPAKPRKTRQPRKPRQTKRTKRTPKAADGNEGSQPGESADKTR